jgi:hypothetical protein
MLSGFLKNILPAFILCIASSCAKEVYTDADAAAAKREAQKAGLTVMVRDVGDPSADVGGFAVSSSQCGETASAVTSADGLADMMVVKGDIVLVIKKEGYVTTTAVVTTNLTGMERNNTVVIVPVFPDTQTSGMINGAVSVEYASSSGIPLANALVSMEADMGELVKSLLPGIDGLDKYTPAALFYSSIKLMQSVYTDVSGAFNFTVPATVPSLTYTVNVHETELTHNMYCSANRTVVTNGRNDQTVDFYLTPYEK